MHITCAIEGHFAERKTAGRRLSGSRAGFALKKPAPLNRQRIAGRAEAF
jgi:hypothetical protein